MCVSLYRSRLFSVTQVEEEVRFLKNRCGGGVLTVIFHGPSFSCLQNLQLPYSLDFPFNSLTPVVFRFTFSNQEKEGPKVKTRVDCWNRRITHFSRGALRDVGGGGPRQNGM